MSEARERLHHLLPAVYRIRDAEHGEPLRALLAVLERELQRIEDDIGGLYDNWFIETCQEWVVPYIGDLLGVRGLVPVRSGVFSQRAYVANTLAYRRRKGTAAVLEQLARDITGCGAGRRVLRAAGDRPISEPRPTRQRRRRRSPRQQPAGAAGRSLQARRHTAEVRHIDNGAACHSQPGPLPVAAAGYAVTGGTARAAADPGDGGTPSARSAWARRSSTGRGRDGDRPPGRRGECAGPLRRRPLYDELEACRRALVDGTAPRPVYLADPPVLRSLSTACRRRRSRSMPVTSATRPREGRPCPRMATTARQQGVHASGGGPAQAVPITLQWTRRWADWHFRHVTPDASRSAMSTGSRRSRRRAVLTGASRCWPLTRPVTWQMGVTQEAAPSNPNLTATLTEAVQAWNGQPAGTVGVIAILDSRTYIENLSGLDAVQIPPQSQLVLVAADWPEEDDPVVPGLKRRVPGSWRPTACDRTCAATCRFGAPRRPITSPRATW
jgi:hypothetical protein